MTASKFKRMPGAVAICVLLAWGNVRAEGWESVSISTNNVTPIEESLATGSLPVRIGDDAISLPCPFSQRPWRGFWKIDFASPLDLRSATALSFDFKCDDPLQFNAFALIVQSGPGFYKCVFSVPTDSAGKWTRVRVPFYEGDPVGAVAAFGAIPYVRLSCYRAALSAKDLFCAIRDFRIEREQPSPVLVIRADSTFRKWSGGVMVQRAAWFANMFRQLGVGARLRADLDVTEREFDEARLVVLPANGEVPANVRKWLTNFVEKGGKVLAADGYDGALAPVLGLKACERLTRPEGALPYGGIVLDKSLGGVFSDIFYPDDRAFVTRDPAARVLAWWADGTGRSFDIPAVVASDRAIHWSLPRRRAGGNNDLKAFKAIVETLVPSLGLNLTPVAKVPRLSLPAGERRLAWVHRDGVGAVRDWDKTARLAKQLGFTDVLGNIRFADLPAFRDACRAEGVRPHGWIESWGASAADVGREESARLRREGRLQKNRSGQVLEWLCPSDPRNVDYVVERALAIAQLGLRGVHLDYVRYSGKDFCFCDCCRRNFEKSLGHACSNWPKSVFAYKSQEWTAWMNFRCTNITRLVRAVATALRRNYSGVELSAAVFPSSAEAPYDSGQCWDLWCREGLLDFLCPMNYSPENQLQCVWSRLEKAWCHSTPVYPGIGYSGWWEPDVGRLGERLREQVRLIREAGHGGFTMYPLDEPHLPEAMGFTNP